MSGGTNFMFGAFLCLLLDVFGLAAIEGAAARDRFPFCGSHFRARSHALAISIHASSRFAPVRGLVILRQTFVRCCQSSHHTLGATALGSVGSQSFENARLRAIATTALTASSRLS